MTTRARRAIAGFLADFGGQAILRIATLVATPLILGYTSESRYGFWLTTLSVLAYLGLMDVGVGVSLSRIVAGLAARSRGAGEASRLVSTAFFSYCLAGALFLILGLALSRFVPDWFAIPEAERSEVLLAFRLAVLAGAVALPLSTFSAIVTGSQQLVFANSVRSGLSLAGTILSLGLLAAGLGLPALALGDLFAFCGTGFLNARRTWHRYPELRLRASSVNRADLTRLWSFGGWFQLGKVANLIATGADAVIIAAVLGSALVTPYALTSKVATLLSISVASAIGSSVFPAFSQMFAHAERDTLQRGLLTLARHAVRLSVVGAFFAAAANREFVSLWVGADRFGGTLLNAVFVYWIVQDSLLRTHASVVLASGRLRGWALMSIAEAVVNIAASLLLIGPLGLVGVAASTSLARTPVTVCVIAWCCRRTGLPLREYLRTGLLRPILRSLPEAAAVTWAMTRVPDTLRGWWWVILLGSLLALANAARFEGPILFGRSDLGWRERLRLAVRAPRPAEHA